jgi:hypothetical protein
VAVISPEDLIKQAELLIIPRQPGPPLQVDVRRAISAAYYAVFHHVLTAAADTLIRKTRRDASYVVVYRSIDHGALKAVCQTVQSSKPPGGFGLSPANTAFSSGVREFGATVVALQARRHTADYDPAPLIHTSEATLAIAMGRKAIALFDAIPQDERLLFVSLLAFKQRR